MDILEIIEKHSENISESQDSDFIKDLLQVKEKNKVISELALHYRNLYRDLTYLEKQTKDKK